MKENLVHLVVSIATTTGAAFLLILATASAALGLLPFPGEYRVTIVTHGWGAPDSQIDMFTPAHERAASSGVVAGKMLRSGVDGETASDL